jgi:TRAP transporter 4TM/12TM fusion protein
LDEVVKFRDLHGPIAIVQRIVLLALPLVGIAYIVDLSGVLFGYTIPEAQYLGAVVGLILCQAFLAVVPTAKSPRDRVPWYDLILAALGLTSGLYLTVRYEDILINMGQPGPERIVLAALTVLMVLEANRRASGWILAVVGTVFVIYGAYAEFAPGAFGGSSTPWPQLLNYLYVDRNGMLGQPIAVTATTVLSFVIFGSILNSTGVGDFFTNFALGAFGRYRGGAAKGAVGGSALFGMISGSAVSNVVVVGSFTIPLMKKTGYKPHVAGAIESVGSTGGQLMPPVMGAAAFLIAQFLAIPYRDVALAAAFPAVLYYICLFTQVDLEAARHGLKGADPSTLPALRKVLKGSWRFAIPFFGLVWLLFFAVIAEAKAGIFAGAIGVVVALVQPNWRRNLRWAIKALAGSSRTILDVGVVATMAGFIVGAMQISGLAFILSNALINLAGGSVPALLVLTAVVALILGMGMPTVAVYVLLAVLVAPALIQMGVLPLAAHLFVFYFGMLSMITPPVCMAAFTAAAIAKANFWKTGYEAMRLAGVAYVVPFMFVASPTVLLIGHPSSVVATVVTAILGTVLLGMALVGYFVRNLPWVMRGIIALSGVALILPPDLKGLESAGWAINLAGFVVAALALLFEWQRRPKGRTVGDTGTPQTLMGD